MDADDVRAMAGIVGAFATQAREEMDAQDALRTRLTALEAENAALREIVAKVASLWLTIDQSNGVSHTIAYLQSRDGSIDVEALREQARALLAGEAPREGNIDGV